MAKIYTTTAPNLYRRLPILGTFRLACLFGLPDRWPLDFFFFWFNTHVESSFILITNWYINTYCFSDFSDDSTERWTEQSRIPQRLVHCNGMFMHDAFFKHEWYQTQSVLRFGDIFQLEGFFQIKVVFCYPPVLHNRFPDNEYRRFGHLAATLFRTKPTYYSTAGNRMASKQTKESPHLHRETAN